MKIKQKMRKQALVTVMIISMVFGYALTVAPTASAAAVTQVTCKDGKKVTAHNDDAKPNDTLNDKDFEKACAAHGGYVASSASDPTGGAVTGDDCGGVETAIIKCDADNSGGIETNGVWALLLMAITILTAGVGIAAVGGIIYGSIMYASAGDNESQVAKAKEIIRNVVIGIIAYVAMYALLQFIIPGGVFS